jgi:hypothetical protein
VPILDSFRTWLEAQKPNKVNLPTATIDRFKRFSDRV